MAHQWVVMVELRLETPHGLLQVVVPEAANDQRRGHIVVELHWRMLCIIQQRAPSHQGEGDEDFIPAIHALNLAGRRVRRGPKRAIVVDPSTC